MITNQSETLGILEVSNKLGIVFDRPNSKNMNTDCPHCGAIGKLNVNVVKNTFHCIKCNTGGGIADLYLLYTRGHTATCKKDRAEAFAEIKSDLHPTIRSQKIEFKKTELPSDNIADIEVRNKVYTVFLKALDLRHDHLKDLERRGLSKEYIQYRGYKSFPLTEGEISHFLNNNNLYGIPGFYKKNNQNHIIKTGNNSMIDGYFVPVRDIHGKIQGFQIRTKYKKAKYIWFSSGREDNGFSSKGYCHVTGAIKDFCYLTEGPLKADVIHYFTGKPCIAVPGNSMEELKITLMTLKKSGLKMIYTALDMDYKENPNVRRMYEKVLEIIEEVGICYEVLNWNPEYKGFDDRLLAESKEKLSGRSKNGY